MTAVRTWTQRTFSALSQRNYRIFFYTQLVSMTGSWMQRVGQAWLVLKLTNSALDLGIVSALQFLPMLLFAPWGGLVADRTDKRRLIMVTQSASGVLGLVLGVLTLSGAVQLWMVYALSLLLGCAQVFDTPARQSFVMEMAGRKDVANAVSLNSAVATSARVVGPALAGILIALVGTGWCFIYNGASFFPVTAGLLLMRPSELFRSAPAARAKGQVLEGIRYVRERPELRLPLLMTAVIGTFAFNFQVVLPAVARFAFHSGATSFGILLSAMGLGAFLGALISANRARPSNRLMVGAALAFGALMTLAAFAPTLPLEVIALIPMGVAMITYQATSNSLLQLNSAPEFRGRVMSLWTMVFLGSTPIGSLAVGAAAQAFGARAGLWVGGLAALLTGALGLLALRRRKGAVDFAAADGEPARPAAQSVPATEQPPGASAQAPEVGVLGGLPQHQREGPAQ